MKNSFVSYFKICLVVCISSSVPVSIFAQGKLKLSKNIVRYYNPGSISKNQKDSAVAFKNHQFWIIHHNQPVSENQFKELRAAGIILGTSFSAQSQLASIPLGFPISEIDKFGFTSISPFKKEFIFERELSDAVSNKSDHSLGEFNVLGFPGVKANEIERQWNPDWGKLVEVWPGEPSMFKIEAKMAQLERLLSSNWVQWIEKSEGELIHFNSVTGPQSRANWIKSSIDGGLSGLDGAGVTVAVGDGGLVETHADLETHQENLVQFKISSFTDHQDHVTGIVGGSGLLFADKQGIAPGARILNTTTSSTIAGGLDLRTNQNVVLTNNSYGINLNCSRAGKYSSTCNFIDNQLVTIPDLLHVFAAGNQGAVGCGAYPIGFNNLSEGYPVSKNILTVGAVIGQDQMAWFSSTGPTMDGRVKPEIVVDGNNIVSTVPSDSYNVKGGTSQAAPAITGILALMVQRYKQIYGNANPENALLKGLLCNSAEDLGQPNVDFKFGFGRVNARKAKRILDNAWFKSGSIYSNQTSIVTITAPANAKSVKIMLVWNDPAAAVDAVKDLINDLDLKVENAANQAFLPWVLNSTPSGVGLSAARREDTLNNMEQVTFNVSEFENIKILVKSKLLSGPTQKYWLVYDWVVPELVITHPLNEQKIKAGAALPIWWDKSGFNLSSMKVEMSTDSGQNWAQIALVSDLNSLTLNWNVPYTNFQKRWFRLNASEGGINVFSNWVKTEAFVQPNVTAQPCSQTAKLTWTISLPATNYEVMVLNRESGSWQTKGFTSSGTFTLNQLVNGKVIHASVRPWKGQNAGLRSDAVSITPAINACLWGPDLGITSLDSPKSGRRLTSSDPGTQSGIHLKIQNFGNADVTDFPVRIFMESTPGSVTYTDRIITLQPLQSQIIYFTDSLQLPDVGVYPVRFWISANGDANRGNDSLFTKIEVYSNTALTLPWQYKAEDIGMAGQNVSLTSSKSGLTDAFGLDFNVTSTGRFKTNMPNMPTSFGFKSLVLDKRKIDGIIPASGELIFTLNLANYATEEIIFLDFDWVSFGPLTAGNSLWMRPNDQALWVEIIRFPSATFTVGQIIKYQRLNLNPFLNGQNLSSSFQIKFTQIGIKPVNMTNGGGYAVDNLMLSLEGNDVAISNLVTPTNGCAGNTSQKVKLKIQNKTNQIAQNVKVGYSLPGQAPVEDIVPELAGYATLDYEFSNSLPSGLLGQLEFKIWVNAPLDAYPGNDSLFNQTAFIAPVISTFPYFEGFEASSGNWRPSSTSSSWKWGTPSINLSIIDTAANGKKMWTNGLTSLYPNNDLSYVESPCFNLNSFQTDIQFSFNSIFSTEQDYDYAWLEVSQDGTTWEKVGTIGEGTNWYTHASDHWNGLRKNWEVSSIRIPILTLANTSNVKFRFGFSSDVSVNSEGFGFDDVSIESAFDIVGDSLFSAASSTISSQGWTHFGQLPNMVASVENIGLGEISVEMKRNVGPVRNFFGVPYLDRNFLILPGNQPTTNVKVRLYVTDAEVKKLIAADPKMKSFQELGIYKYDGPAQDLTLTNNDILAEKGEFLPAGQVQKTPTAGGYFLEFMVDGFSEFYIASSSLDGPSNPLAVSIISFKATPSSVPNDVTVIWETASEVNSDRYELCYSDDGKIFSPVDVLPAYGEQGVINKYVLTHTPFMRKSSTLIYQLKQFDLDSTNPKVYWSICQIASESAKIWVENPIQDRIKIYNLHPNSRVQMTDVYGRVWFSKDVDGGDFEISAAHIPKGKYWLEAKSATDRKTIPLLKTF